MNQLFLLSFSLTMSQAFADCKDNCDQVKPTKIDMHGTNKPYYGKSKVDLMTLTATCSKKNECAKDQKCIIKENAQNGFCIKK